MTTGEEGLVAGNESMDAMDTSGNVTGSDFDDETEEGGHMAFGELLNDPEKDEGQDPPSSTTGDHHEKPSKRASQGQCHPLSYQSYHSANSLIHFYLILITSDFKTSLTLPVFDQVSSSIIYDFHSITSEIVYSQNIEHE